MGSYVKIFYNRGVDGTLGSGEKGEEEEGENN